MTKYCIYFIIIYLFVINICFITNNLAAFLALQQVPVQIQVSVQICHFLYLLLFPFLRWRSLQLFLPLTQQLKRSR